MGSMAINPLPPQAYTKETLQKAYSWLLSQPTSTKEMAHDQSTLVSLYLRAVRNGEATLEVPSAQQFKKELKFLANRIETFQDNPPAQNAQNVSLPSSIDHSILNSSNALTAVNINANQVIDNSHDILKTSLKPTESFNTVENEISNSKSVLAKSYLSKNTEASKATSGFIIDSKSQLAVDHVKQVLNVGSDDEAIRILITFGIKYFKQLDLA